MRLLSKFFVLSIAVLFVLTGCMSMYPQSQNETDEGVTFIPIEDIPVSDETPEESEMGEEQEMEEETQDEQAEEEMAEEEEPVEEVPEESTESDAQVSVTEGELVRLDYTASDPDGDPLTYSYTSPLNEEGEWQTKVGDAGTYMVTITATDSKGAAAKLNVEIIVNALNKAPVFEDMEDIIVDEGDTITLEPEVTDPEGDDVTITYEGWMTSDTYKTTYQDAGEHVVTIRASDGSSESTLDITVMVNDVNRAPIIESLSDIVIKEGEKVTVNAVAADPDGDNVEISYSEPLDDNGEWQTEVGDADDYRVTVTASDGTTESYKQFFIVVEALNEAPVIQPMSDMTVTVGDTVVLSPKVTDPDGDDVTISYSGWMTSNTYTTKSSDAGKHTVKITASDGKTESSIDVNIEVNRPPVFG